MPENTVQSSVLLYIFQSLETFSREMCRDRLTDSCGESVTAAHNDCLAKAALTLEALRTIRPGFQLKFCRF